MREAGEGPRLVDRLVLCVLAALLMALGFLASPTGTTSAGAADGQSDPPRIWRSYPLNHLAPDLTAQVAQAREDACDFATRQREPDTRALLIFLVGRANDLEGQFGVGRDNKFTPNSQVYEILLAAGRAYRACRTDPRMKTDIAYGVTNYELSEVIESNALARQAGLAQVGVAKKLDIHLPRGVGAAVAGDIEPGWDPYGSDKALSLVRGGAGEGVDYYNFGTAGRCPPFGDACQGDWTPLDLARASQGQGVIPLPQIYYPNQARTWANIADLWDRHKCPKRKRLRGGCYVFGGATSHPVDCANVTFTPRESFRSLRQASDHHVERRLIYFNPRRVSCA